MNDIQNRWRRWGAGAALGVAGLVAGGALAGTLTANAADSSLSTTTSPYAATAPAAASPGGNVDESKSLRPDEHLLSGDTATQGPGGRAGEVPGRDGAAGRDRL